MSKSPERSGIMSLLTDEEYIEHLARSKAALEAQYQKLLTGAVGVSEEHIGLTDRAEVVIAGRRAGTDTTRLHAIEKAKQWVDQFELVKVENPTWKRGAIWDEVAARLEDTPYKGNARYMQDKIKILPD